MLGSVVIKSGAPQAIRIEAMKLAAARSIATSTGLFRVPEILDWREEEGVLVLERIKEIEGVRHGALSNAKGKAVAAKIGMSLAAIHLHLRLPESLKSPLPHGFFSPVDQVFIHGDFSGENVCVTPDSSVVIIDWQMTPRYGGLATYGSRYFDMCWFLCNLFRKPVYRYLLETHPRTAAICFIAAYIDAAGSAFCQSSFDRYFSSFYEFRTRNPGAGERSPLKRLLLAHGYKAWNDFMKERRYA